MARTIRRKNEKWLFNLWSWTYSAHEFYYDNKKGRWHVPGWYCQMKDRPRKRRNAAEVRKIMKDWEYEPTFTPFKHNSDWW